jgi:uncharacterized GH25 family protein
MLACALLSALLPARALGHNSWLITDKPRYAPGETAHVTFATGEIFPVSDTATEPDRIDEGCVFDDGYFCDPITSRFRVSGHELMALVGLKTPGAYLIAASLHPKLIELPAKSFAEYLKEEKELAVIADRHARGEDDKPGRELYTKYAKTVALVRGDAERKPLTRPIGHGLEIVPTTDPVEYLQGGLATFVVLLEGKPLVKTRLSAAHPGLPKDAYAAEVETDESGTARIALRRQGPWFVRTHFMRRAKDPSRADWESSWASFTFYVAPRTLDVDQALASVKAIHGAAGPWVMAGFRMGQRALEELRLERGSWDLEVIHESPQEVQYTCIADGVQAATGVSAGKLNLKMRPSTSEAMRTVFRKKSTGETVIFAPTAEFKKKMLDVGSAQQESKAREVAAMPADQLMRPLKAR